MNQHCARGLVIALVLLAQLAEDGRKVEAGRVGKAKRGNARRAATGDFVDGIQAYEHGGIRVQAYAHFLSDSEAAELIVLGDQLTSEDRPAADREHDGVSIKDSGFRRGFFSDSWRDGSKLLGTLWERAVRVTMIPENDNDSWLKYHVDSPLFVGPNKNRPLLRNIHHDRADGKEGRALTLLVYLSTVKQGGHTVFPCIGPDGGPPLDQALCDTFVDAYVSQGQRAMTGGGPAGWNVTAFRQVEQACAAAAVEKPTMLSVKPRTGLAVLFPSSLYGGQPAPQTWHAGCPVLSGQKHAIQFFRESPPSQGVGAGGFN